jgi:hypothetical protein
MLALKSALYVATIAAMFFFGFWELRIKRELTEEAELVQENPSNLSVLSLHERVLRRLPRERLSKYHVIVGLKFLFFVLLVVEVIVLQR